MEPDFYPLPPFISTSHHSLLGSPSFVIYHLSSRCSLKSYCILVNSLEKKLKLCKVKDFDKGHVVSKRQDWNWGLHLFDLLSYNDSQNKFYFLILFAWVPAKLLQSCLTLCDPTGLYLPGSSVYGILQSRILEWVTMVSSRGSSLPRDQTSISYASCIGKQVLYH